MPGSDNTDLDAKLRRVIETIDIGSLLVEPLTRSIEQLLSASAATMGSNEASVLIRDGDEGDLRFFGERELRHIDDRVLRAIRRDEGLPEP